MTSKRKFRIGDVARVKGNIHLGEGEVLPAQTLVKVIDDSDALYDCHIRFKRKRFGAFVEELELHRSGATPIKPGCPFGIPGARSL